jgi:hypothetical protein
MQQPGRGDALPQMPEGIAGRSGFTGAIPPQASSPLLMQLRAMGMI